MALIKRLEILTHLTIAMNSKSTASIVLFSFIKWFQNVLLSLFKNRTHFDGCTRLFNSAKFQHVGLMILNCLYEIRVTFSELGYGKKLIQI